MENFKNIRKWFSGKSLQTLDTEIFPLLQEAETLGYWPKGRGRLSSRVKAALNKQTEAIKFAYAHDKADSHSKRGKNGDGLLESIHADDEGRYALSLGWSFCHAMMFGHVENAPILLTEGGKINLTKLTEAQRAVFETALGWAADFAPVATFLALLDVSRPQPTYIFGTLSPTVVKTLQGVGLSLRPDTVRMPKIRWEWREDTDKNGKPFRYLIGIIEWPENTVHSASRFANGTAFNAQCHACGHAIKNAWNWVPLLMDDTQGIPHSFWVGRDCAKKLFGVDMDGEAQYEGRV